MSLNINTLEARASTGSLDMICAVSTSLRIREDSRSKKGAFEEDGRLKMCRTTGNGLGMLSWKQTRLEYQLAD